jgi:hypothetical protein
MTDTQKYALVLLYLGYISTGTPYYTADLYAIYMAHKAAVDAIFANPSQLQMILQTYVTYLPSVVILDPNAVWGP